MSDESPSRCLGLRVSGPFAHFRKIGGNSTRQTYRIMPRTTVAGMLAAIVGRNRDSYYDAFQPENSSIAIVPATDLRTISIPISELSTAPKDLGEFGAEADVKTGITTVSRDSMSNRQRNPYEMLRDVEYRIYVHTEDKDLYTDLRSAIKEGTAHYTPILGLSECLASIAPVRVDDSPRVALGQRSE